MFLVNICSATVDFTIPQGTKTVTAGGTVTYDLQVSLAQPIDLTASYPITEVFSVDPQLPSWTYTFSKPSVDLDTTHTSDSSVLSITVPQGTAPGLYTHTVYATGYDPAGKPIGVASEIAWYVVNTNVSVPEFPSVVVPVAAILGLVVVFGRRKT